MKDYEFLPHTADVRILAKGDTLAELFSAALLGLCEVLIPDYSEHNSESSLSHNITVKSIDSSALIVDFLSEILGLMHTKKALFPEVIFDEISNDKLSAKIFGFFVEGFLEDVKAVTYHEVDIKLNESGQLETLIVLDI